MLLPDDNEAIDAEAGSSREGGHSSAEEASPPLDTSVHLGSRLESCAQFLRDLFCHARS